MPSPVTPSQFKDLIVSASGNFCEKFLKILELPSLFHSWFSWMFNEDGSFTDEFKADICALNCSGTDGGTTPPGTLPVSRVTATDGQYLDKVGVSWTAVAGASGYDLYRATSNVFSAKARIAQGLSGLSYDDSAVTPGLTYYYWVRAYNAVPQESWSAYDTGYASSLPKTLPAVADLVAGKGLSNSFEPIIALVWSPAAGADSYDIYASSTNNFSTATVVGQNRVPFNGKRSYDYNGDAGKDKCWFDQDRILYLYTVPASADPHNAYNKRYFWVVAKRILSDPAQSDVSNAGVGAAGWAAGDGTAANPLVNVASLGSGTEWVIPGGTARIWVALFGGGANGAGSSVAVGGGGGGGGGDVTGHFAVAGTGSEKVRVASTPTTQPTRAVGENSGSNGTVTAIEYSADGLWDDIVTIAATTAPVGGTYDPAGSGAGGAGGSGTGARLTDPTVYDGTSGLAASDTQGGMGGARWHERRQPAAHYIKENGQASSYNGDGPGGAGAEVSLASDYRKGGQGQLGNATLVTYAS